MTLNSSFQIKSHLHSYEVTQAKTLKDAIAQANDNARTYFLVDDRVAELYPDSFAGIVANRMITITATEEQKSYEAIGPLFSRFIEMGLKKDAKLVVVGGGVTQDVGCFIASILNRGIRWELIPTTLLAQSDSCIGSKSSVNLDQYKNQLGTFYPPHRVTLVFSVLKTLAKTDIHSGLGEIIKLALIEGPTYVSQTRLDLQKILNSEADYYSTLGKMVFDSLEIKKRYIEIDEFDRGVRNLLNYGHTFGHAFESATHYKIPHGIAVLLGIATATYISEKIDFIPSGSFNELNEWIKPFYHPFEKDLADADLNKILSAMKTDKKNSGGMISCILTRGPGKMEKKALSLEEQIQPLLKDFFEEFCA